MAETAKLLEYHDLISSVIAALEARDTYTSSHSFRVAELTQRLCAFLSLSEQENTVIHIAAHLHDIGKIGIPDAILQKSGPLTAVEWLEIRKHPIVGYDILHTMPAFYEIPQIVRHHHERWDGAGYPYGLLGKQIPLGSRIIAVADSNEVLVPISQVRTGDEIVLHTASVIPLDGKVVSGEASVNQASLTGESLAVLKAPGAVVYAGTVVEEGECVIRVEQQSGSSRYNQIVSMIEESEKLKSTTEDKAARLADKLVPYSLAGTALTWLFTRNITRAISILMVDFSCALKLSMPLTVLSAMRECGSYHITVKGGKFLEAMAKADTIVFDKTGTLTHATPTVAQIVPFGGRAEVDVLRIAACLEEHYPHSMANAVVRAAKQRGISHDEMHSDVAYVVAHGIASCIDGEKVVIDSHHFIFEDEGCIIPENEQSLFDALAPEYSHLYLAIGGQLAGVICVADPLREEASAVLNSLRKLGISKAVMMTGDNERTAAAIARQVGVDIYYAEVLPEDKARFVEQEKAAGRTVVMIGDGINDSPALSAADVGIAISDGAAIAREIADITIAADDLFELVLLKMIANGLLKRINGNYRFVMGFNGTLIILGALGILPPATSALLHNLSTLGVSIRSMTNLLD